jgi:hypothetical protein
LKKLICIGIITLIPLQAIPAQSEDQTPITTGITLDTARKITSEYYFSLEKNKFYEKKIFLLSEQNNKYLLLSDEYIKKISLLEKDKDVYKVRGDRFEEEYNKCSDGFNKCTESKPSRFTWFGVGFVSACIVGITGIVLIK